MLYISSCLRMSWRQSMDWLTMKSSLILIVPVVAIVLLQAVIGRLPTTTNNTLTVNLDILVLIHKSSLSCWHPVTVQGLAMTLAQDQTSPHSNAPTQDVQQLVFTLVVLYESLNACYFCVGLQLHICFKWSHPHTWGKVWINYYHI